MQNSTQWIWLCKFTRVYTNLLNLSVNLQTCKEVILLHTDCKLNSL